MVGRALYQRCPLCGTFDDLLDVRAGELRLCGACAERRRRAERAHTLAILTRKATALLLIGALMLLLVQPALAAEPAEFQREVLVSTESGTTLKASLTGQAGGAAVTVYAPDRGLWREAARWNFATTSEAIVQEIAVGADTLTISLPVTSGASATVAVNGQEVAVSAATLAAATAVQNGVPVSTDVPEAAMLEDLLASMEDRDGFAHGLAALGVALDGALNPPQQPMEGCVWKCWSCATALATYGISIGGLIAACGATLGLGCLLALLGHEVAAAVVLSSCSQCLICLRTGATGRVDGDGDPGGLMNRSVLVDEEPGR